MSNIKNIAVIGCGQLGRRHIQGLGKSNKRIKVHVYDISQESLNICKEFILDIAEEISNLDFVFFDDLKLIGSAVFKYDLIIVASTANQRSTQLGKMVSLMQSRHWLIEKPLSQSPKELDELNSLLPSKGVWINHIRRFIVWHQNLQDIFCKKKIHEVVVTGPKIGIGCNVSHFVDLVNFWTSQMPVSVDVSGLNSEWHDSDRFGFKEIDGSIKINFSDGLALLIVSDNSFSNRIIKGTYDSNKTFAIDENHGTITIDGVKTQVGRMPFQSELTGLVFDQIDQTDRSVLTPYPIAADCYRPVIEALLNHWTSTIDGAGNINVPLT